MDVDPDHAIQAKARAKELARLRQVHQYLSLSTNGRNENNGASKEYMSSNSNAEAHTPLSLDLSCTKRTSPNTALTAFTQLVTYKLDAQRAIISLVDRDHQYFLAESTPTLDLDDPEDGDWLWMGCSGSTGRDVALCAQTIQAPAVTKGFPSFVVNDLSDSPYKHMPYVQGTPHFRYYAGTPLITPEGYRIGSLFVIDDRPRAKDLTFSEVTFLGIMAQNIMQYLNMQRESEDRKRVAIMSKGLAAFTEGLHRIPSEWRTGNEKETGTSKDHASKIDTNTNQSPVGNLARRGSAEEWPLLSPPVRSNHQAQPSFEKKAEDVKRTSMAHDESQTHSSVLARASNLLRESLDVDFTVFLDTKKDDTPHTMSHMPSVDTGISIERRSPANGANVPNSSSQSPAAVLSFSTRAYSSSGKDSVPSGHFNAMEVKSVKRILKKYPHGHLWSFNELGKMIGEENAPLELKEQASSEASSELDAEAYLESSRRSESDVLTASFPGVRQILFSPVYDPTTTRCISACFAVSLREVPVFTTDIEVAFARAFVNNVAVEWDRVTIAISDRQKSDFLSSISHEFRSPLHGILASTELLSDSELDTSQRGLCDTIESCGQTLLNTVSHILDYSKVNNFHSRLPEKNGNSDVSTVKVDENGISEPQENLTSIGLYSKVDVARICEAVVQTVCAGHSHAQTIASPHIDGNDYILSSQTTSDVAVILNIHKSDWEFICAPGAIQRILMNLVGNSLKYTPYGWVKVELTMASKPKPSINIIVRDSGIGISQDFLRHKLYAPFTQESTLAPGTGLGLSMVKKIVQTCGGDINIESQLNKGTSVTVQIPIPTNFKRPTTSSLTDVKDSTATLISEIPSKTVALYGFEPSDMVRHSLVLYATEWFGYTLMDNILLADFVIVDEKSLDQLIATLGNNPTTLRILVLRSANASLKHKSSLDVDNVFKPIGPNRLAKSLISAWSREPTSVQDLERRLSGNVLTEKSFTEGKPAPIVEEAGIPLDGKSQSTTGDVSQSVGDSQKLPEKFPIRPKFQRKPKTKAAIARNWQPQILAVDDNLINLKLLQAYLKKLGYTEVSIATDGLQAFNLFESADACFFDLIFMDLSMPVCDGFESTARIRKVEKARNKTNPRAKVAFVVALTGQASKQDQDMAFTSGVDHFITKPMSLSQLETLMAEWELRRCAFQTQPL